MLLLDELLYADSHNTLLSVRAVIGHDDKLVAALAHFVLKNDKVARTSGNDREDTVARSLQGTHYGKHRSHSHSTAGTNHRTELLDVCWITERTNHVGNIITFVQLTEFCRRKTYFLYNNGYCTLLNVCIGNGKRHTLALVTYSDNDKVTCLAALGNHWCLNLEEEYLLRKLVFSNNLIHFLKLKSES